jgi:hypothetical protein
LLFAYYPDSNWLAQSPYLSCSGTPPRVAAVAVGPQTTQPASR